MRVGIERVLELECRKLGNYKYSVIGHTVKFYYHTTVICAYNRDIGIFFADNRDFNTVSTNRNVNDCRYWCEQQGMRQVTVDEFERITKVRCERGYWVAY